MLTLYRILFKNAPIKVLLENWNSYFILLQPYDYQSVMHYGAYAFSANGQKTIEPLQSGAQIGNRQGMTQRDKDEMNAIYGWV